MPYSSKSSVQATIVLIPLGGRGDNASLTLSGSENSFNDFSMITKLADFVLLNTTRLYSPKDRILCRRRQWERNYKALASTTRLHNMILANARGFLDLFFCL